MASKTEAAPDAFTENGALCYASTGQPVLDLFFSGLVRGASKAKLNGMMGPSWDESAEATLRVLQHARDCRGGKGEKDVVRHCLLWLREHKPRTYKANLRRFLECGYYKDLMQLAAEVTAESLPALGEHDEVLELEILAEDLQKDMDKFAKWKAEKGKESAEDDKDGDQKMEEAQAGEKEADEPKRKKKRTARCPVTLAAKWAPTEGGHFDKKAKLAKRLAKMLFPEDPKCLQRYRKTVTELRENLNVVERLICAKRWSEIDFGSVPSRAHHILKKAFKKHAQDEYEAYLTGLQKGTEKINTQGLMIHELTKQYIRASKQDDTIEAQFKDILTKLKAQQEETGKGLGSAIAVCDVSGSMSGIPMEVCIALGILVSQLAAEPWNNRVLTFSSNPQWHTISPGTLFDMVKSLSRADWGMSTDLEKAFDRILSTARQYNVPAEAMPSTLFIFSDMQFNSAVRSNNTKTSFQVMKQQYADAGYEMPQVVFWNLRGNASGTPVKRDENGVALVSGFSQDLLKLFMSGVKFDPLSMMERAIEKYEASICESER